MKRPRSSSFVLKLSWRQQGCALVHNKCGCVCVCVWCLLQQLLADVSHQLAGTRLYDLCIALAVERVTGASLSYTLAPNVSGEDARPVSSAAFLSCSFFPRLTTRATCEVMELM